MACGTPVIAFGRGAMPEVVESGVSGWLVDDVDGAVAKRVSAIDRLRCRRGFESRFTAARDGGRVRRSLREPVRQRE
jgi:glycosyltransferase involved in cell wall biosynthesis